MAMIFPILSNLATSISAYVRSGSWSRSFTSSCSISYSYFTFCYSYLCQDAKKTSSARARRHALPPGVSDQSPVVGGRLRTSLAHLASGKAPVVLYFSISFPVTSQQDWDDDVEAGEGLETEEETV